MEPVLLSPVLLVDEGSPPDRPEVPNNAYGGHCLQDSNDDLIHDDIWFSQAWGSAGTHSWGGAVDPPDEDGHDLAIDFWDAFLILVAGHLNFILNKLYKNAF